MCGIVGYVGKRPAVDILVQGLKRLEYRGYDSAGVAYFIGGQAVVQKSEGKLENVEKLLQSIGTSHTQATCGIGHTRWATHGKPTTQNAHPHRTGHVLLVHNGIIENYQEIKKQLMSRGHKPLSETDSELFGFLVMEEMDRGLNLVDAVRKSFQLLQGQCSVVVMSEREPSTIVGVRNGSPLVAALDPQGGAILASDAQAVLQLTQDVYFLEHGDLAVARADSLSIFDLKTGKAMDRKATRLDWSADKLDKQGFPHFMLKEIFEQPTALVDTFNGLMDRSSQEIFPLARQPGRDLLDGAQEFTIVACGSSWHAALLGKYWLEQLAKVPVHVELASEYRYRDPVLSNRTRVIGISQSGETADTLAVLRAVKDRGCPTLGITNVRGSSISREADAVLYTSAGPEIGVAATKTFTTQLLALLSIAGYLAKGREARLQKQFSDLIHLPHFLAEFLRPDSELVERVKIAAKSLAKMKGFFFIGRGYSFPVAMEGALKLKEIAYLHAEGYAAGELKHGPIAMIDSEMVVVVLAPRDLWRDKTVSNLEEVKARGAKILAVGDVDDGELESLCDHFIPIKTPFDPALSPFVLSPVMQLLSYEIAVLCGTDVDKPRNLAKSVTVE